MQLYSNCCNAPDKLFRRVLDMNYSEMDICPNCGEHCHFSSDDLIKELEQVATGNDLISFTIRQAIENEASHIEIIDYIKSQARDNIEMMQSVIGETLTTKILTT